MNPNDQLTGGWAPHSAPSQQRTGRSAPLPPARGCCTVLLPASHITESPRCAKCQQEELEWLLSKLHTFGFTPAHLGSTTPGLPAPYYCPAMACDADRVLTTSDQLGEALALPQVTRKNSNIAKNRSTMCVRRWTSTGALHRNQPFRPDFSTDFGFPLQKCKQGSKALT